MNIQTAFVAALLAISTTANVFADLVVNVAPPKITGNKAVISLSMNNTFSENIESARAVCFLLDDHDKVVSQSTKWVIGGTKNMPGLAPSRTNIFNFVISANTPFVTTNLTTKVSFTRLVMKGGTLANAEHQVVVIQRNN